MLNPPTLIYTACMCTYVCIFPAYLDNQLWSAILVGSKTMSASTDI